ncbi:Hypothetical predicted protein, partial [Mytilus galloprovincialis]
AVVKFTNLKITKAGLTVNQRKFTILTEPERYACNFEQDFCNWLPEINTSAFNWTRIKTFKDHTTELPSINDNTTVPYNTEETFDMTGLAVAIVTCGGLVVCLIIAGICVFKRKTEKQLTLNTDKISNKTDSMNISKTNEVRNTQQRVGLAVHEYVEIDLSKDSSCSDRTKNKENIFRYELAKPLTSDPGGAFRYDLAKPLNTVVKDGRSNDIKVSNKSNDRSEYDTTKMNESTKYNGYNETENIVVYSRTFDGVYDVASNGKRNVTSDNAYEHCAIQDKQ